MAKKKPGPRISSKGKRILCAITLTREGRRRLRILADEANRSMSSWVETQIDELWDEATTRWAKEKQET